MVAAVAIERVCTALEQGARIVWEERARIVWEERTIRGPRGVVTRLTEEPRAVRALMRRASIFREELQDRGPDLPRLILSGVKAEEGACYSCGEPHPHGGRCPACAVAVYLALDLVPPRDVVEATG
jgi:hypothetical protein